MRILFDNVNLSSNSGPNSFGRKLAVELSLQGQTIVEAYESPDVQLTFIQAIHQVAPIVQRIDGIWFNSAQDWKVQNIPISNTFSKAKAVIVQSQFDQKLIEKYFGKHNDVTVINNGCDIDAAQSAEPLMIPALREFKNIWVCASSWRPHKRLGENIRYFLECADKDDCLIIAGDNPDVRVADKRIFYAGNLDHGQLLSLYKTASTFIHLAYLDHNPNVVVDARASGCHIVCASSGGTEEIAGFNSVVVEEDEWNFEPCELYNPPKLNFSKVRQGKFDNDIDIKAIAAKYLEVLRRA